MTHRIKILIIDDSAVARAALEEIFSSESDLQVIGKAANPYDAARLMADEAPDVITLDLEMPRMDGLTFLKKLMRQHPIPVVVCSSLATHGADAAVKALELGAVDIIAKPQLGAYDFFMDSKTLFCDAIRAASKAQLRHGARKVDRVKHHVSEFLPDESRHFLTETTEKLIVVGASTGGTEALATFLSSLPADSPGILIVQHMPEQFTSAFARRLDSLSALTVREAKDGDPVLRGHALLAPGGRHMYVKRSGARYVVKVKDGPLVNRHRPSVDVLFRSTAQHAGLNAVGVIMTGMGDDGAQGCCDLKEAGATVLAQDEASCVVFGMPRVAIERGAATRILPLEKLAEAALAAARSHPKTPNIPASK